MGRGLQRWLAAATGGGVWALLSVAGLPQTTPQAGAQPQAGTTQAAGQATECAATAKEVADMRSRLGDWGGLRRYAAENGTLGAPAAGERRVVFLGDSITDAWGRLPNAGEWFAGRPYVNRGISGQTTPQMLVRFEQDVVRLRPAVVVILAGVNDVAGNTGPETVETIEDMYRAMTALAKANGIRVVWASVLPANRIPWRPGMQPAAEIWELNGWLQAWCVQQGCTYLDYYTALASPEGGMREGMSKDGVHPTSAGYAVMAPLAERAIGEAERAEAERAEEKRAGAAGMAR